MTNIKNSEHKLKSMRWRSLDSGSRTYPNTVIGSGLWALGSGQGPSVPDAGRLTWPRALSPQPRAERAVGMNSSHGGQSVFEYCFVFALLLIATMVFWRDLANRMPGQLTQQLERAIACTVDYTVSCQ